MKKKFLIFAVVLFGVSLLKAQNVNGVIKANPLGFIYSVNLSYEKPISYKGSINTRFRFYYADLTYEYNERIYFRIPSGAISLKAGYRHHLSSRKDAPEGFYLSPTANIMTDFNVILPGVGGELGYEWVFRSGFVIDLYSGFDVMFDGGETAFLPIGGVSLGFAF